MIGQNAEATIFMVLASALQIVIFEMMNDDFKFDKSPTLIFECPLLPFLDTCKSKKDCCRKFKKGDRCKKCPGRKK